MYRKVIYPIAAAALLLGSGAALGQTTKNTEQDKPAAKTDATTSNTAAQQTQKITLTETQAKSWVDKPVYSSTGEEIGEVVSFKRGTDNVVLEMHADIGGTLGMGEKRVKLGPSQFKLQDDRVVLSMTEEQAKNLPKAEK